MYKGTLIDKLLGVVESAEKSSGNASVSESQLNEEPKSEVIKQGENHSPKSSRSRLV